jgi:phthiodiolone/phenolphthiodiolone dimycocerosates ketoreductase
MVLRDAALCGTPDEVVEQAAQWRDCGVRYLVLANLSFLQRSMRKGLTSALSFGQIVQGVKKL